LAAESLKDVLVLARSVRTSGAREREARWNRYRGAMAEGVDAIAIDVGHVPSRRRRGAGHELDADHGPGFGGRRIGPCGLDLGAGGNALSRFEAEGAELRGEGVERGVAEAAEETGVAI